MPSRRYLSIWLRRLPTDRITRAHKRDNARPLVVTADIKSARRLISLNDAAADLGLHAGMALADARAMYPDIDIVKSDCHSDHALLESIADWCDRYTPLIGLDAPDGLALDIAGCAHLFGGEAALLRDIVRRLSAQGFAARATIADTFGGAWALARYGTLDLNIVPSGVLPDALLPLPLAALRLDAKTVVALSELGLKKIADLIARPRAPLAARFGVSLLRRLDQALGDEAESVSPRLPPPCYVVEQRFAEPIALERDILSTAEHLARRLSPLLERRGEGARQFELAVFRVDGCVRRMSVATSRPSRDPVLVHRLFADKILALSDAHDPGFGFDLVRLSVTHSERSDPVAIGFDEPDHATEIAQLIDRLGARFGLDRVARLEVNDTHIPEFAVAAYPASSSLSWPGLSRPSTSSLPKLEDVDARPKAGHDKGSSDPPRPVRLFEKPERIEAMAEVPDGPPVRFRWRRVLHHIAHAEGPERIAMEWWRDEAGRALTRDYFRVENAQGARFWIFRDGLYERETPQPRWFLHGVLA